MFRLFCIRILLKLLRIPLVKVDEKRIQIFLWTALPQQGFQDYVTKRDMELLQHLGNGVQRDEYLTALGQRIELGLLLSEARKAFQKIEKDKKEKIEAMKIVKERKIIKQKEESSKENEPT